MELQEKDTVKNTKKLNSDLMKAMLSSPWPTGPQFHTFEQMEKLNETISKDD